MKKLKEIYSNDEYDTYIVLYECEDIKELIEFISQYEKDDISYNCNFTDTNNYLIEFFDCIMLTEINIFENTHKNKKMLLKRFK